MEKIFETEFSGQKLMVKIGYLAPQANGACLVQYGETVVLATAVMGGKREVDFFPLFVDYEERFYAAGKIKGSRFIKRETRPPDEAVLSGRLIDRSLRPFFNQELRREIQVIATVLATDQKNDPDIVALYAASIALAISDIPWDGPVAGLRIGLVGDEWVINPNYETRAKSRLDFVVCGLEKGIIMLEAGAEEISEETFLEAIKFAFKHINRLVKFFQEIQGEVGKTKNLSVFKELSSEEEIEKNKINECLKEFFAGEVKNYLFKERHLTKEERVGAAEKIREAIDKILTEKNIGKEKRIKAIEKVNKLIYQEVSRAILEEGKRVDGRGLEEIRPLEARVGVFTRLHGSALFQRGETQVLSTVTLGAPGMEQYLDTMEESGRKRFMHHYNFPPFSSGEVASLRSTGRRETGHSMLVEKGLLAVLPDKEKFPYTIRVVSEVFSSNGSTSMAATCASSLALMDAGVPLKRPVAGIAVGLASQESERGVEKYKTFVDLQDLEDGPGGMDFKVIGTTEGVTAVQMDTKTHGLSFSIIEEAFKKAKLARGKIFEFLNQILSEPRKELSPYAPRIATLRIEPEKIRDVVGPGGRVINEITKTTGVTIDIEQDGLVTITSPSDQSLLQATTWIRNLTKEVKIGEVFQAKVKRLVDFGAFVELSPNQEALIHISELAPFRVGRVSDLLEVNDVVPVKVIKIDEVGKIAVSLKEVADQEFYRKKIKK